MSTYLENSTVATGLEKVSFHSNPKEWQCKECSNYHTITLISNASKVMLKILSAKIERSINQELPDGKDRFTKGKGTIDQIASIHWVMD